MNLLAKTLASITVVATATLGIFDVPVMAITLSNGSGPGTVSVDVDEFGSFGTALTGGDALYTPADGGPTVGTVTESGVIIRGVSDQSTILSTSPFKLPNGGTNQQILNTSSNSVTSSFRFGDLLFNLEQILTAQLDENNNQTGSVLTQTYTITNASETTLDFELFRYIDPTLIFTEDNTNIDGGGRIDTPEFSDLLFVTDTVSSTIDPIRSLGITATGGTIPETGRYQVDSFDRIVLDSIQPAMGQLPNRVLFDTEIGDNDGILEITDLPEDYPSNGDIPLSLALNNLFSIDANQIATYTTRTIFGVSTPTLEPQPEPVPESASILGLLTFGALGAGALLKRKS
jgi:hypothetical protein